MPIFSGVLSVGGTGRVPEGNSSCTGLTLGLGEGLLRADRCCRSCSTEVKALAKGISEGLGRCISLVM